MIRKKKFIYTTQNFVWSEVFILFVYYHLFCSKKFSFILYFIVERTKIP